MTPFLIIDGYNLLHAAGLARMHYGPGDLDRARQKLLALLAERLRFEERRRCCVVFDALHDHSGRPRRTNHFGIDVQFAPEAQDADTEIEDMIARHPACRKLVVISGDHRLQQAARRRGAKPVDSDEFFQHLERQEPLSPYKEAEVPVARARKADAEKPLCSEEDWSEVFGAIDVAALAEEIRHEPLGPNSETDAASSEWEALQRQLDDPAWLEQWLKE
jgi:predicted RNA-binding protein with PIN domain